MTAKTCWAALLLALAVAPDASASPSIWDRARRPDADRRAELVAEAEQLELKYKRLVEGHPAQKVDPREISELANVYLSRAAELLEQAGAATSGDPFTRFRLADLYGMLRQVDKSRALLEALVATSPPPAVRAMAYGELAICYAKLGRPDDEIRAYSEALAVQAVAERRALLLANRAEAFMVVGDITSAVGGYRSALGLLSPADMIFGSGATTLWGLAVALDRSGDLQGAFETVQLARSYDAQDRHLNGPNWFYVPDYDRHWYEALGHWTAARKTDVGSVRIEAYGRAATAWKEYIATAAPDDRWVGIARARLRQCEKESDEARKRAKLAARSDSKSSPRQGKASTRSGASDSPD